MRMWMVNPVILCSAHLGGEHVETHMFVGSIHKQISLQGYVDNNLLEITSLQMRHDVLAYELIRRKKLKYPHRNFTHESVLPEFTTDYYPKNICEYEVDKQLALGDLIGRCETCKNNYLYFKQVLDPLDSFYILQENTDDYNNLIYLRQSYE